MTDKIDLPSKCLPSRSAQKWSAQSREDREGAQWLASARTWVSLLMSTTAEIPLLLARLVGPLSVLRGPVLGFHCAALNSHQWISHI